MFFEQTQMAWPYRFDWHQGSQPTTEASDDVGQDAWPYGYKRHGHCCFPYGPFEAIHSIF